MNETVRGAPGRECVKVKRVRDTLRIEFTEVETIAYVGRAREEIITELDSVSGIHVDVRPARRVDAAVLQLLVALRSTALDRDIAFDMVGSFGPLPAALSKSASLMDALGV